MIFDKENHDKNKSIFYRRLSVKNRYGIYTDSTIFGLLKTDIESILNLPFSGKVVYSERLMKTLQ